ncbi:hypothetical protein PTSG_04330 [Salpingoeca rosetta]|uniref:Amidohydrolase-related domain-containing protein n=1 Tax=Salpingoeca rosetta (strain ATCC 50818 / BSB-021) TaxID=946362 RepID=F2U886_SALR5|nr:uncharacterized protein PTSG_04330 [Salpingoeca rosetta]EGD72594.1 hypothetical protein PTSG_04330 [Salpingoeca rosetta]|eukprot:XP_004994417.1 hypothetical protein PTSG_04330 [Salpingoeca rosetta]
MLIVHRIPSTVFYSARSPISIIIQDHEKQATNTSSSFIFDPAATTAMDYQLLSDHDPVVDEASLNGGGSQGAQEHPVRGGGHASKSNSFSGTAMHDPSAFRSRQGSMPPAVGAMGNDFEEVTHFDISSSDFGTSGPKASENDQLQKQNKRFRVRMLLIVAAILTLGIIIVIVVPKKARNQEPEDPLESCIIPYEYFDTQLFAVDFSNVTSSECRDDRTIDTLWNHNMYGGVLVQPSTAANFDNSHMLQQLELYNKRLRGVISFNPLTTTPLDVGLTVDELERLEQIGVRGIRWNLRGYSQAQRGAFYAALKTPEFKDLFKFMQARRWHIDVAQSSLHWRQLLPHLEDTGVRIVVDNFGGPASLNDAGLAAVLDAANSNSRMWIRLSGARNLPLSEGEKRELVDRIIDTVPLTSLLWGSAYSDPDNTGFQFDYADRQREFRSWFPRFSHQLMVLKHNANDVYGFMSN